MILFLSHSLGIVTRTDHDLISMLHDPAFVDPMLSLIISFLVLHTTIIIHLFKSYLSLLRSSTLLSTHTVSRLA
jgi:hypothetical protein